MAEHDNLDLTYEEALQELQDILGRMQSNELGIDSLTENIQRASLLLDFCQGKLQKPRPRFKRCSNDSASKTGNDGLTWAQFFLLVQQL